MVQLSYHQQLDVRYWPVAKLASKIENLLSLLPTKKPFTEGHKRSKKDNMMSFYPQSRGRDP